MIPLLPLFSDKRHQALTIDLQDVYTTGDLRSRAGDLFELLDLSLTYGLILDPSDKWNHLRLAKDSLWCDYFRIPQVRLVTG